MGLKEILDEISRESEELNTEAIMSAKMEAEQRMLKAIEDAERNIAERRTELAAEIKRRRIKLKAKAELEAYRDRQKLEVSLIENVLKEALKELIDKLKHDKKSYLNFLKKLVKASVDLIGSIPVEISLSKDDMNLFSELAKDFKKGELVLAEAVKIYGGVICRAGGSYVDNSIENIFEKQRPAFLKMISEELA
jgi:vacuolar-type H+-ATPase subunit E/Vma4